MTSVATDRAANISARCKGWASSGNAKSRPYMWWSSQSSGALQIRPLARRRRSLKVSISNRRVRYEGDNGGLNPHFAIAFDCRGIAYSQKGDYDRAIEDYNQTIRLIPNFPGAFLRGEHPAMAGDNAVLFVDQHRVGEAKFADRGNSWGHAPKPWRRAARRSIAPSDSAASCKR